MRKGGYLEAEWARATMKGRLIRKLRNSAAATCPVALHGMPRCSPVLSPSLVIQWVLRTAHRSPEGVYFVKPGELGLQ